MRNNFFIQATLSENDRRLLIIVLIILLIGLLILGLIGMLIRFVSRKLGQRADNFLAPPLEYGLINNPKDLRKYGFKKNNELFFKQAFIPVMIALGSVIIYLIHASVNKEGFSYDYWGHFKDLLFRFDWDNPDNYAEFFGVTLLRKFPGLLQDEWGGKPHLIAEHWASYVLVPLWLTAIIYDAVVVQAYLCRTITILSRSRNVFQKDLSNYKYKDPLATNDVNSNPPNNPENK